MAREVSPARPSRGTPQGQVTGTSPPKSRSGEHARVLMRGLVTSQAPARAGKTGWQVGYVTQDGAGSGTQHQVAAAQKLKPFLKPK